MPKRSLNSFTGILDEIPEISVDNFEDLNKRAYFLSHCHTDHTNGLFLTDFINALENRNVFVYMSASSAAIVMYEATDRRIDKFIKPLEMGRTSIILSGNSNETVLNVTLIPAGHCFGSVMFLFNVNNKNILYSGDFRIRSNDISKYRHLHRDDGTICIDSLYVDTTFQNVMYENFPKRSESTQYVIDEVKKWLSLSDYNSVALHTSAKYGYESVFNEIYKQLGIKVCVNERKWELYRNFATMIPGLTNTESKIHLCANSNEHKTHENCVASAEKAEFLYIHLSAMIWSEYCEENTFHQRFGNRLNVCFSTHCSRSELMYFIEYLNPKRVVGFPEPFNKENSKVAQDFEVMPKKRKIICKNDMKKVDSELLKDMFEL